MKEASLLCWDFPVQGGKHRIQRMCAWTDRRQTLRLLHDLQTPGKSEDSSGTRAVEFVKAQDSLYQNSLARADGGRQG